MELINSNFGAFLFVLWGGTIGIACLILLVSVTGDLLDILVGKAKYEPSGRDLREYDATRSLQKHSEKK